MSKCKGCGGSGKVFSPGWKRGQRDDSPPENIERTCQQCEGIGLDLSETELLILRSNKRNTAIALYAAVVSTIVLVLLLIHIV